MALTVRQQSIYRLASFTLNYGVRSGQMVRQKWHRSPVTYVAKRTLKIELLQDPASVPQRSHDFNGFSRSGGLERRFLLSRVWEDRAG
jgi:hypothetical protein